VGGPRRAGCTCEEGTLLLCARVARGCSALRSAAWGRCAALLGGAILCSRCVLVASKQKKKAWVGTGRVEGQWGRC
jgi:hypothetical protein